MYNLIIRYTQQTSEDTWSLRHTHITAEIPELDKALKKYDNWSNPHVIDVQPANSEKNLTDKQQIKCEMPKTCASCPKSPNCSCEKGSICCQAALFRYYTHV